MRIDEVTVGRLGGNVANVLHFHVDAGAARGVLDVHWLGRTMRHDDPRRRVLLGGRKLVCRPAGLLRGGAGGSSGEAGRARKVATIWRASGDAAAGSGLRRVLTTAIPIVAVTRKEMTTARWVI